MLNKMSLKVKLLTLTLFLCSVSVVVGAAGYFGLRGAMADYEKITENVLPNVMIVDEMYAEFKEVRINLRSLGLAGLKSEDAKAYVEKVEKAIAKYEELNKKYLALEFVEGEQEKY